MNYDCSTSDNMSECVAMRDFFEGTGGCAWISSSATTRRLAEADVQGPPGQNAWGSDDACNLYSAGAPDHCCWFGVTCDCSDSEVGCVVTKIELVGNNLVGSLSVSIAKLDFLVELVLSYNYLSGGINSLSALTNLEILMLDNNELTGEAEALCDKPGKALSFFSVDCDTGYEVTACSCCFCTIQLGPSDVPSTSMMPSNVPSDVPSEVPSD